MPRLIASFVLCLFAWGPLSPLAITAAGDPVPACCRRDGKHHCMMMAMARTGADNDGSPRASRKPDPCPYRSLRAIPAATSAATYPPTTKYFRGSAESIPVCKDTAVQLWNLSSAFSRGPPEFSSYSNS